MLLRVTVNFLLQTSVRLPRGGMRMIMRGAKAAD
jgi:hypothetical protein